VRQNCQSKNDSQWKANKREWLSREDSPSPTAALKSIILAGGIDAHEERNIMTCNIPDGFMQALVPETKAGDERAMMKIAGVLVDALIGLNPESRGPCVVQEKARKALCVRALRAIGGVSEAALLWLVQKIPIGVGSRRIQVQPMQPTRCQLSEEKIPTSSPR